MSEKYLKVSEVAEILRVSQMTVIRKCREGYLPFIRVGTMRRIREIDLEYYLLNTTQKPKSPEPARPVYDGPPADECGFEDDVDAWKAEMNELCLKAKVKIDAENRTKQVLQPPEPPPIIVSKNPSPYPSGFDVLFDGE